MVNATFTQYSRIVVVSCLPDSQSQAATMDALQNFLFRTVGIVVTRRSAALHPFIVENRQFDSTRRVFGPL